MPTPVTAQSRIADLQAEIEALKQSAISELMQRRNSLGQQLAEVDAELAQLTGKSQEKKTRRRRADIVGKAPSFRELKELLTAVPEQTLNLRKEGLDAKHIKQLAADNPGGLKMGGKGAWPTVTLVK